MKVNLGPDAPPGCNGKPGTSGAQNHRNRGEEVCGKCKLAQAYYYRIRRSDEPRAKPLSSRQQSAEYPFKYGKVWFREEKDRDEYAWRDRIRKAASRAGWPTKTVEDLEAFEKYREDRKIEQEEERVRRIAEHKRREALRLKQVKNRMVFNKYLSEEDIKPSLPTTEAEKKLALIRQMIEDRTPIKDFMIRTSQLVGVDLRKVSNGKG